MGKQENEERREEIRKSDEKSKTGMKKEVLRVLIEFIWLRRGKNMHVPVNTVLKLLGL